MIDTYTAINSGSGNTWVTDFTNPGNGTEHWAINNLTIPANTIKVYVAGRSLGGAIGLGGPGGYSSNAVDQSFLNALQYRGQFNANPATPPVLDFGTWGGSISFDSSVQWSFSLNLPNPSKNDFLTVATHELAHVLGFGTSPSWKYRLSTATTPFGQPQFVGPFTGPKSMALYGGPVPLETPATQLHAADPVANAAHFQSGVMSSVGGVAQETIMDPDITVGTRKKVTLLDWAALDDIGWDIARPGDVNADGAVDFNDLILLAQNYNITDGQRRWSQGDFNYDGKIDFNDLVMMAQNYNTVGPQPGDAIPSSPGAGDFAGEWSTAQAAAQEVPEPSGLVLSAIAMVAIARRKRA